MAQPLPQSVLMDYFGSPHLVIMESDSQHAQELAQYLERQGFRVSVATSGQAVRDLITRQAPDLLIFDLIMPDVDSLELCQKIKLDSLALGYLPVIMLTETQEEHQRLAGMLSGADEYLSKPVVPKELLLRVQALLRIKRQIDQLTDQNATLVTDLEEHRAELEEAHQVAEQMRLLQRHFIHNVNHEFRTPLLQIKSSIAMLSTILKREVDNSQAHKLAAMATQATARLEGVFQNIAQFEVFENIRREPLVLKHAINSAVKHFQRSWAHQSNQQRIQTYLGVELPPVLGDQRAVTRLLINLIDNGLKFSEPDQPVEISVRLLEDQGVAWVGVKDHGIGIPPDRIDDIFKPFSQLDSGSTREYDGLGVGLTIAQMLARGMGTSIDVRSTPGAGSLFAFTLPLARLPKEK